MQEQREQFMEAQARVLEQHSATLRAEMQSQASMLQQHATTMNQQMQQNLEEAAGWILRDQGTCQEHVADENFQQIAANQILQDSELFDAVWDQDGFQGMVAQEFIQNATEEEKADLVADENFQETLAQELIHNSTEKDVAECTAVSSLVMQGDIQQKAVEKIIADRRTIRGSFTN